MIKAANDFPAIAKRLAEIEAAKTARINEPELPDGPIGPTGPPGLSDDYLGWNRMTSPPFMK